MESREFVPESSGPDCTQGQKPCDRCQAVVALRYRIQHNAEGTWELVCPACWKTLSQDNPHYRYGGTWKARSQRRKA